jgi:hypothetical protein
MDWLKNLTERSSISIRTEAAAQELAEGALNAVIRRMRQDVLSMSNAEARGYVRARAAAVVEPRLVSLLGQPEHRGLKPAPIREMANALLAQMVTRQAKLRRGRATITPVAMLRAA